MTAKSCHCSQCRFCKNLAAIPTYAFIIKCTEFPLVFCSLDYIPMAITGHVELDWTVDADADVDVEVALDVDFELLMLMLMLMLTWNWRLMGLLMLMLMLMLT